MKQKTILTSIIDFVFGQKYYANIVNTKGSENNEVCSFIFKTKEDAERHRKEIESTLSFRFVETISFRSRNDY